MHLKLMDGKRKVSAWDAKRYTLTHHPDGTLEVEMGVYEDGRYRLETIRLPEDGNALYVMDAATGKTTDAYKWPFTSVEEEESVTHITSDRQPEIRKEFRTI